MVYSILLLVLFYFIVDVMLDVMVESYKIQLNRYRFGCIVEIGMALPRFRVILTLRSKKPSEVNKFNIMIMKHEVYSFTLWNVFIPHNKSGTINTMNMSIIEAKVIPSTFRRFNSIQNSIYSYCP